MINKLTKEQSDQLTAYKDKWLAISLDTNRSNKAAAENYCRDAYKAAGLEPPKFIFWAQSPLGLLLTAKLIKELAKKGFKPYSEADLSSGSQVAAQVGNQVWDQVAVQIKDQIWNQIGSRVWDQVKNSSLLDEWGECRSWGQHDANWLGFYDFFLEVTKLECCEKLLPLMNLAKETGWHLFYKDVAILSEKPTEVHRNPQGSLHKDQGPALKWADGYLLYSLNGIRVPESIALLKPEDITKDTILKQENADYRREIVRKLSAERLVEVLGAKVIDSKHGYELLGVDIGDNRVRPFLKMKNPSVDAVHIEGVRPGITTVEEAICYRNGLDKFEMPKQLT